MFPYGRHQLGPHRLWHLAQQGKVAVGGATGDQVEHTQLLQPLEAWDQLSPDLIPLAHHRGQLLAQVGGGRLETLRCLQQ